MLNSFPSMSLSNRSTVKQKVDKTSSLLICMQERSQAEARKPGLQHHIIDTRNPDFS